MFMGYAVEGAHFQIYLTVFSPTELKINAHFQK